MGKVELWIRIFCFPANRWLLVDKWGISVQCMEWERIVRASSITELPESDGELPWMVR